MSVTATETATVARCSVAASLRETGTVSASVTAIGRAGVPTAACAMGFETAPVLRGYAKLAKVERAKFFEQGDSLLGPGQVNLVVHQKRLGKR